MLGIHDYWLFVATGVLLNLTPGQDTLYILGRSIAQDRQIGVASALGISAGGVVHTLAAALGLSAILATSASAFIALKVVGAVYLVYLGARMLTTRTAALGSTDIAGLVNIWTAFRQGMLTSVLNPKVALFFLALMPQFIEPDIPAKVGAFLVLGLTFLATGTVWCLVLALGASRVRGFFADRPRALQGLSQVSGVLFIFLGLRLAASKQCLLRPRHTATGEKRSTRSVRAEVSEYRLSWRSTTRTGEAAHDFIRQVHRSHLPSPRRLRERRRFRLSRGVQGPAAELRANSQGRHRRAGSRRGGGLGANRRENGRGHVRSRRVGQRQTAERPEHGSPPARCAAP